MRKQPIMITSGHDSFVLQIYSKEIKTVIILKLLSSNNKQLAGEILFGELGVSISFLRSPLKRLNVLSGCAPSLNAYDMKTSEALKRSGIFSEMTIF